MGIETVMGEGEGDVCVCVDARQEARRFSHEVEAVQFRGTQASWVGAGRVDFQFLSCGPPPKIVHVSRQRT